MKTALLTCYAHDLPPPARESAGEPPTHSGSVSPPTKATRSGQGSAARFPVRPGLHAAPSTTCGRNCLGDGPKGQRPDSAAQAGKGLSTARPRSRHRGRPRTVRRAALTSGGGAGAAVTRSTGGTRAEWAGPVRRSDVTRAGGRGVVTCA